MGYNKDNYCRLKREFEEKSLNAESEAEKRRAELHAAIPEIAEIDATMSGLGLDVLHLAMRYGGAELDAALERLKKENAQLQSDRGALLIAHGYPADYDAIKHDCDKCGDTGFIGTKLCSCLRRELILAGYESSGIGNLIRSQSFDTFDPEMQSRSPEVCAMTKRNLELCRAYAENFQGPGSGNMLLIGATGLGKTHLSTAVAKTVIERGYDVVYDTAQNIFADFEYERFGRSYGGDSDTESPRTLKYFECDLLILDDLGTELSNQFTISCLYNIINTRINHGLSTIINTNLGRDELRKRYADRVTSRLFGEFHPLLFSGSDVRALKLGRS